MHPFLTFAIVVSVLYACLWIFAVAQDWHSRRKLSRGSQATSEAGE